MSLCQLQVYEPLLLLGKDRCSKAGMNWIIYGDTVNSLGMLRLC